jgi:spore coat polysaccharide biosynthesis protein SpsF
MSSTIALILQARMGSRRLPGKSMLPLAGSPLLARIIERVKRCTRVDRIVVATTRQREDDVLARLAQDAGVDVFRGAEDDLVDRYYQAARASNSSVIVRLPADNPVPEPAEIDRIIAYHLTGQSEFSSNLAQVFGNGYPNGIGAEVFTLEVLETVWKTCRDPRWREHPHLNFFDYALQQAVAPERYRVGTVVCPAAFRRPELVLDVNTREEYEFMARLYEALYPQNPAFHITDILRWYDTVFRVHEDAHGRLPQVRV